MMRRTRNQSTPTSNDDTTASTSAVSADRSQTPDDATAPTANTEPCRPPLDYAALARVFDAESIYARIERSRREGRHR